MLQKSGNNRADLVEVDLIATPMTEILSLFACTKPAKYKYTLEKLYR